MSKVKVRPPRTWSVKPLSEIAEVIVSNVDKKTVPGEQPVRLCNYIDVYNNQNITPDLPFMDASASQAEIVRFRLRSGDVIITKDSETPNDIGIPSVVRSDMDKLVCGYHLSILRLKSQDNDPVFLARQLNSPRIAAYFGRQANGTTRYGLGIESVGATEIWLAPPDVQRRIALILDTADATISKTEALIAKLKQMKAGLLRDRLSKGISENGYVDTTKDYRAFFFEHSLRSRSTWRLFNVGELLENGILAKVQDGNHGELHPKATDFVAEGIPFLMANDLKNGEIDFDSCHFIRRTQYESLRIGFAKPRNVLLSHKGTIGQTAIVPNEHEDVMLTPQVTYYAIADENVLLPEYLMYWFQSHWFQRQLSILSAQSTRQFLGITGQKKLQILIPSIEEQRSIANCLATISSQISHETSSLTKQVLFKAGMMNDLLTGINPVYAKAPLTAQS